MTRHSTALAQHLAWNLQRALCRDHTEWWNALEIGHHLAETNQEADRHLHASNDLCQRCPVQKTCDERAHLDGYTGLAAGKAFLNGHEQTPRTTT